VKAQIGAQYIGKNKYNYKDCSIPDVTNSNHIKSERINATVKRRWGVRKGLMSLGYVCNQLVTN